MADMQRVCPHCGFINAANAIFCGNCGRPLVAGQQPAQPQDDQEPMHRRSLWGPGLLLLSVIAGLLFLIAGTTFLLLPRAGARWFPSSANPPRESRVAGNDPTSNDEEPTDEPADGLPGRSQGSTGETPTLAGGADATGLTPATVPTVTPYPTATRRPTVTPSSPAPEEEVILAGESRDIVVDAGTARTETDIPIRTGQLIRVEVVGGSWRAGPASVWPLVGGRGDPQVLTKSSFPIPDWPIMSLVGGVGDGLPLAYGDGLTFTSATEGELWLGPNDDNFADNTGELVVRVTLPGTVAEVPTAPLPTATAIILPTATVMPVVACQRSPGPRWVNTLWKRHQDALGCALTSEISTTAAFQYYQGGLAIWRQDADRIYMLYRDGTYASYRDDSPDGYFDSDWRKGGFGYLWNNNNTVRNRLGQPEAAEFNATDFVVQDFAGGTIFYFLENDARNYVLFTGSGTWLSE